MHVAYVDLQTIRMSKIVYRVGLWSPKFFRVIFKSPSMKEVT
jgi:hypothetical protein